MRLYIVLQPSTDHHTGDLVGVVGVVMVDGDRSRGCVSSRSKGLKEKKKI